MTDTVNKHAEKSKLIDQLWQQVGPKSDALSLVLERMQLKLRGVFHGPRDSSMALRYDTPFMLLHLVVGGALYLHRQGQAPLALAMGDVVISTLGTPHTLSFGQNPKKIQDWSEGLGERDISPGDYASSKWVTVYFSFESSQFMAFFKTLPEMAVASAEGQLADWLNASVYFLNLEMTSEDPGSQAMLSRISEIVFIRAIRTWFSKNSPTMGFSALVFEPRMAAVVQAILSQPHERWTIRRMAELAALSPSTFTSHFRKLSGITPMAFVLNSRMDEAKLLLLKSTRKIVDVALHVGYDSEAAFSRAFKRLFQCSPNEWRQLHRLHIQRESTGSQGAVTPDTRV